MKAPLYLTFNHLNLSIPILGEHSPKMADLQAHNTSQRDVLSL